MSKSSRHNKKDMLAEVVLNKDLCNSLLCRDLVDSIGSMVLFIDGQGDIVFANRAVLSSFGLAKGDLFNRSILDIISVSKDANSREPANIVGDIAAHPKRYKLVEGSVTRPDGKVIDIEWTTKPVISDNREVKGIWLTGVDITKRKEIEGDLEWNRTVLARAGRMSRLGIWDILFTNKEDINKRLHWSDEVFRIIGYEPGSVEVTNDLFLSHVHPDDRVRVTYAAAQALESKRPYSIEHRIIRTDSSVRTVLEHVEITFDLQGQPLGMIGTIQDITDRKLMEDELRSLAQFPNVNPSPVMRVSRNHDLLFANAAGRLMIRQWDCSIHSGLPETLIRAVEEALESGSTKEIDVNCGSKTYSFVLMPIVEQNYVNLYGRDVSERKRTEEDIRQLAEELEKVMNVVPVAIWVAHDPECRDITGNKTANEYYEAEEWENVSATTTPKRRFYRDGKELTPEELPMQYAAAHNVDVLDTEFEVLMPSGTWRTLYGYASPLRDVTGKVRGAVGAFIDVTERKQAVQKEREMEARQNEFFRNTILAATNGKLSVVSPREIEEITGVKLKEWTLNEPSDLYEIRKQTSEIAEEEGMDHAQIHKLITCLGEATNNAVKHVGSGTASVYRLPDSLLCVVSDHGSGIDAINIPNIALTPGYSTVGTLGMGYKLIISSADKVYLSTGIEGTIVAFEIALQEVKPDPGLMEMTDVWTW